MSKRTSLVLKILLILLLPTLFALLALRSDGDQKHKPQQGFQGALRPESIPAADFTLKNEQGQQFKANSTHGKPTVVSFMYSTCRDECPVMAQQIRGALDDLGHDVPVVAVSVDPVNDTAESAKRFLLKQKLTGRMHFLLGNNSELQRVWRQFGISPQEKGRDHSAYVVVLDRTGKQRVGFPKDQLTPERLTHDLKQLEDER